MHNIRRAHSPEVSRRGFLTGFILWVSAAIGAIITVPALGFLVSPANKVSTTEKWVDVGKLADVKIKSPTAVTFNVKIKDGWVTSEAAETVFIVREDEKKYIVLSNQCTHLSCRVAWHPDKNEYICPCHNGIYDMEGGNISGPPPRPLDRYKTKLDNGHVFILVKE